MDTAEGKKKVGELTKGIRSCMFVTQASDGGLNARPMSTQEMEFDGSIWFMTDRTSNKVKEVEKNSMVGLEYSHSNGVTYVSLTGKASLVEDRTKIKEFWNPFLEAWFDGPEDEKIVLIKVEVTRASYWNNKGGKVGALADMAIGAITGEANTLDEQGTVTF